MATNQEGIIAASQTATSGSGYDYGRAIYEMALAETPSITNPNINGALIEYLQSRLSSSQTNINGLLTEYSALHFDGNVNSINDLTKADSRYQFQNGDSYTFQDGTQFDFN